VIHPIIDACLEAARHSDFDVTRIERVELAVNPLAVKLCDRPNPVDCNQAHLSLQHWAAVSLLFKAAGLAQITEAMVRDLAVGALRRKIVVAGTPEIGREAASVRVLQTDGRTVQAGVAHCRGSVGRPLTDDDISEKTRLQLQTVFPAAAAENILAECWRVETHPVMRTLSAQLAIG
jgi:2-methylcitrate dehydratase PrpD